LSQENEALKKRISFLEAKVGQLEQDVSDLQTEKKVQNEKIDNQNEKIDKLMKSNMELKEIEMLLSVNEVFKQLDRFLLTYLYDVWDSDTVPGNDRLWVSGLKLVSCEQELDGKQMVPVRDFLETVGVDLLQFGQCAQWLGLLRNPVAHKIPDDFATNLEVYAKFAVRKILAAIPNNKAKQRSYKSVQKTVTKVFNYVAAKNAAENAAKNAAKKAEQHARKKAAKKAANLSREEKKEDE
jgi:hypothetical protein